MRSFNYTSHFHSFLKVHPVLQRWCYSAIVFCLLAHSSKCEEPLPSYSDAVAYLQSESTVAVDLNGIARCADIKRSFAIHNSPPFRLFSFPESHREVRIDTTSPTAFEEYRRGKWMKLTSTEEDDLFEIGGVNLEDLNPSFLFWKKFTPLPSETIRGHQCLGISFSSEKAQSRYSSVSVWVTADSYAPLRAWFYIDGKLNKQMEVVSIQKIEGKWQAKEIRVSLPYVDNRRQPLTYIDFYTVDSPKEKR